MSSKRQGKRTAKQAEPPQWIWSEARQDYYWLWTDQQGEVHYMWQNGNEEQATPRTAQVDSIAETLEQVQLSSTYDETALGGDDGYNHDFTTAQTAEAGGKAKGKAVYYGAAGDSGAGGGFGGGSGEGSGGDGGGTWPADPFLGRSDAGAGVTHDQDALPDQEYTADYRYTETPELQQALAASSRMTYSAPQEVGNGAYSQAQAGSSSAQYVDNPEYLNAAEGGSLTTQTATNMTSEPDITGTPGREEWVDPGFRVESSYKFQPGNIFKILWADPKGQGGRQQARPGDFTEKTQLRNDYGELFYVSFRRFIVVANDRGHATCVPIYTYLKQGCTKPGVKPEQHGIIHENGTEARLLPNEGPLGVHPIRMDISLLVRGEKLDMASRVNYAKLTSIEHNVKVLFIGSIVPSDFDSIFRPAIKQCWEQKTHERPHAQHHERRQERPNKQRNRRR